jgi:hypothetical protein
VNAIFGLEAWISWIVEIGISIFMIWAFVDCCTRKAPAFPAAGKLSKPAWLLMTGIPGAIGLATVLGTAPAPSGTYNRSSIGIGILTYLALIVSSVYMADVRPAVREISGPKRW